MNELAIRFGKRLEIARESRGLNQADLSKLSNISQSQISKFESGERELSSLDLDNFSKILDYPIKFFHEPVVNFEVHLDFRKGKTVTSKSRRKIQALVNRTRFELKELLESIEIEPISVLENIYSDKPENAASAIRQLWNIPKGPIHNLIDIIENHSIILFPIKFPKEDKFSACAIEIEKYRPLIIYNENHSIDRIRFSIAHELGHIFLHHYGSQLQDLSLPPEFNEKLREDQANSFASEFLMPTEEIRKDLADLSISKLQLLKYKWRVSMASILERAYRLEIIDYNKYIHFRKEFSFRKWIFEEPGQLPLEVPKLLKEVLEIYKKDFGFTIPQIAERLGLHTKEFTEIYLGKLNLRIIKS